MRPPGWPRPCSGELAEPPAQDGGVVDEAHLRAAPHVRQHRGVVRPPDERVAVRPALGAVGEAVADRAAQRFDPAVEVDDHFLTNHIHEGDAKMLDNLIVLHVQPLSVGGYPVGGRHPTGTWRGLRGPYVYADGVQVVDETGGRWRFA